MRSPGSLILLAFCLVFFSSAASATPVYLSLDSRYPSGHHPRSWLTNRTKQIQFQRWFRVKIDSNSFGWLPEDHTLTPLKLASQVIVTEDVPGRSEAQMDSLDRQILKKNSRALILEVNGSWARVQPLPASTSQITWIPTESLQADFQAPAIRGWLPLKTKVYLLPGQNARVSTEISSGRFVTVNRVMGSWIEILSPTGGNGYIRRDSAVLLSDLGPKTLRPLLELTPLRSAPLPYADLLSELSRTTKLTYVSSETLRWGQARVPEAGSIWWPISETPEENSRSAIPLERVATEELFKREIYDMAASPSIRSLKFASAKGIYRTVDGQEWTKIPEFKNQNHPIAIAKGGSVFVGPFVSDDHGETFEQWIRWDSLLATLKRTSRMTPNGLQILAVQPQDPTGRKVSVKLNIGGIKPVTFLTLDQGQTWTAQSSGQTSHQASGN